ncbi:MAG: hypothetical protein M0R40_06305, partial [Firmicutes bacterium]|nr:hypothetical protein [Bacillota bacterium]
MKNQIFRLFGLSLCFMLALNLVVLPRVSANPTFYWNEDFEGADPLSNYPDIADPARTWSEPENTKIRLTFNATGTALEMCGTAKSSVNKDNFIGKMHDGIIFEAGKTYIFETEFLTNNANTRKELFRYG